MIHESITTKGVDQQQRLQTYCEENSAPKKSHNKRNERPLSKSPGYINREIVLPCVLEPTPVFRDRNVLSRQTERDLLPSIGVIVPPGSFYQLPVEVRLRGFILASPYENGRVLENDQPVIIDGKPHTATFKGGGCTTATRTLGSTNPWIPEQDVELTPRHTQILSDYSFCDTIGLLSKPGALNSVTASEHFQSQGIDCERIGSIYKISKIYDREGVLRPVEYFKDAGIIHGDVEPVIVVRFSKSNFRLMDLIMLDRLGQGAAIPELLDHVKQELSIHLGSKVETNNEYFAWLANKVLSQELDLMFQGSAMSPSFWQDHARNISVLGEELDCGPKLPDTGVVETPGELRFHVSREFKNLRSVLCHFGSAINNHCTDQVSFGDLVDVTWRHLTEAVEGNRTDTAYRNLKERNSESKTDFLRQVFIQMLPGDSQDPNQAPANSSSFFERSLYARAFSYYHESLTS